MPTAVDPVEDAPATASEPALQSALTRVQQEAVTQLMKISPVADTLGELFAANGFALHLVGGSVRDALLGRLGNDLDFTTDARPADIQRIVRPWADSLWDTGIAFGTVGATKDGYILEITTYRSDLYDGDSRNPQVTFGDDLEHDLVRRDFTVNAMAVSVPGHVFTDPFRGLEDLAARRLDTPGTPSRASVTTRCACCGRSASSRRSIWSRRRGWSRRSPRWPRNSPGSPPNGSRWSWRN